MTLLLWLCTAAGLLGTTWWFFDLFAHFKPQYTLLFLLCVALFLWCRHWRGAAAALLGAVVNGVAIASVALSPASALPSDGQPLRVVSLNVARSNHELDRVAAFLATSGADVVVLQELSAERSRVLAEQLPDLPHRFVDASSSKRGAVVFSRWPFTEAQAHELLPGGNRAARVKLRVGGIDVNVVGVHLHWPLGQQTSALRNAELVSLARLMSSIEGPRVLVGDFNITPWSGHFSTFVESAGLRDCIQGRWPLSTWPATGWPLDLGLGIRIDQCFHSPDIVVADVRTGSAVGSDHYPTVNDLRLPVAGPSVRGQDAATPGRTRTTPPWRGS